MRWGGKECAHAAATASAALARAPRKRRCNCRKHATVVTVGYMAFVAGDMLDTRRDVLVCTKCGRQVPQRKHGPLANEDAIIF